MQKDFTQTKASGKYEQLKFECMNNGGSYMVTTVPIRVADLFEMIYMLYRKGYFYRLEVHYPLNMQKVVVPLMQELQPTLEMLGIVTFPVEVSNDLIPYQVFILPEGKPRDGSELWPGCISVIDPVGIEIYEKKGANKK